MKKLLVMDSPIGKLTLIEENKELICLDFGETIIKDIPREETAFLKEVKNQLAEYFEGRRQSFDVKLNPKGTEFQKKVWTNLLTIPYGETASYKKIAILSGNEKASRAVGMANNRNPIPIIIPCHRVVGKSGSLTGYGGGIKNKIALLEHEKNDMSKYFIPRRGSAL